MSHRRSRWKVAGVAAIVLAMGVAGLATAGDAAAAASGAEVVAVSPTDTPEQITAKAATVVPSARQLAWQRLEQTAFLHFGVDTYDGRQVGTGTEDPNIFQPTGLDTDQWVRSLKDAGFTQAILTAKHHDGFLLFQSKYSRFSVASSSWNGGSGDVVKSFTDSAHKYGMKVGIYISPADLHEAQPGGKFANGSRLSTRTVPSDPSEIVNGKTFSVKADDYNTYFMNTLYELMTRYGTVDEVWWDGANPTGADEPYDYTSWIKIVRALQPSAVMFQDIDVRWVGNEDGVGRQTEWSPLPYAGVAATAANRYMPPATQPGAADKGSDSVLAERRGDGTSKWDLLRWSPAECDTSMMNGGYFWFPGVTAKSQTELNDIYYTSVGRNCQLLINVPPDREGKFDQTMLDAVAGYGNLIKSTFADDLASGAKAANDAGTTNAAGHGPGKVVDGNLNTSWQPTAGTGALVLDLGGTKTFDVISVQEDLHVGQRTQAFAVDAWDGSAWNEIATDTTIGNKKLIRLVTAATTSKIRLRLTASRAAPAIASVGLFKRAPGSAEPPKPPTSGPIRSGIAGKCLDTGGSNADEARAQLSTCNDSTGQVWTVMGDGTLQLFGKCLDVYGGRTANGTAVELYSCNGGGNQKWKSTDGALVNPQSGRCLDPGSGTADGTVLVIADCTGSDSQKWTLP